MEIYLVGGAVRDQLLGLQIKERDWVVVGATPHEMLELNFRKVGRDFPVFLHPVTREEYALARTERKTGRGYLNFICYSDPRVTLKDDLKRRDLTINAIAQSQDGKIIDPYNGYKDLKKRILRHVSPAFVEDPVRVLRVARFAARFGNFKVHPKTNELMKQMAISGEIEALVPERVWQELDRALGEKYPKQFFMVLNKCQVLQKLFPELIPHLAEIKRTLPRAVKFTKKSITRFATLTFYLNHEEIKPLCRRYKLPRTYIELSLLVNKFKGSLDNLSAKADDIVTLLEKVDAYRRPQRFQQFLLTCRAADKKLEKAAATLSQAYQVTEKIRLTPKTIVQEDKNNLGRILHDKRKKQVERELISK